MAHTADVRLKVSGTTLEEIFRSALEAMAYLQKKDFCSEQKRGITVQEKIKLKAADATILLIDFLSEALTLSQINKAIYCEVIFEQLSATNLIAVVSGSKPDNFDEDIKAVTYHEAELKQNSKQQFETVIIFDI